MLLGEVVRLQAIPYVRTKDMLDMLDKTVSVFPKYRVTTPGLGALDR